ncbi:MAG: ThiF family adenylyltransferase [Candidatus Moraniibacteriota bacterium]
MKYSIIFLDEDYDKLRKEIFNSFNLEGAAFLVCGESASFKKTKLIVREVISISKEHILRQAHDGLSIDSQSYANTVKKANQENASIIFVHSHPDSYFNFSRQDEKELKKLHEFFAERLPERNHGSLVLTKENKFSGKIWKNKRWKKIDGIAIIGKRFRFLNSEQTEFNPSFFDRQVLVFGDKMQKSFQSLHIGIVGAGGTGSCVAEQVARLGIGQISIFDDDKLEKSNISRVFGSTIKDVGKNKAKIVAKHIKDIGLGTKVNAYSKSICEKETAKKLRNCDIIFGCSDTHSSRGILMRLSHFYLIPIIDVAVLINSIDGIIEEIVGRVTTIFPGEACLFCRKRINPEIIALEGMSEKDRQKRISENYAPELETNDPSVIAFTSAVSCQGVTELLHRLTNFKGAEYNSTEMLMLFDKNSVRTNNIDPEDRCLCMRRDTLGVGDKRDFLGLVWQK